MANLAQTINVLQSVILTNKEKMILTPTYHVMEMYNVHQDATLIPLTFTSPNYVLGEEKLPALSVSASKDKNNITHISLVNIDPKKALDININLSKIIAKTVNGRILSSSKLQNFNSFENPNLIKPDVFKGAKISGDNLEISLPAFSVVVLTLQ
jgi:alpha-N-arabinofuranosidase